MKLHKKLFFILICVLPWNLGRHFVVRDSYLWGMLIDYLVPTIYLQDILAFLILVLWFFEGKETLYRVRSLVKRERAVQILVLFLFSLLLAALSSLREVPSFAVVGRIIIYSFLSIYVIANIDVEKDLPRIFNLFVINTFLLSLLGIAQFLKQGALFNNYLFFGEQPYTSSTFMIARKPFFGDFRTPPYGLFRHPNAFGGFLSIVLIWVLAQIKKNQKYKIIFLLGLITLFCTLSYAAWISFILGLSVYFYISNKSKESLIRKKFISAMGLFLLMLVILTISPLFVHSTNPSVQRRSELFNSNLDLIRRHPLFGVGPGLSVTGAKDFRFVQPVHNIFLLIFSENGVFAFTLFFVLLAITLRGLIKSESLSIFFISLLQFIFIGLLDHYPWTLHQTQLLFWLTFGLAVKQSNS